MFTSLRRDKESEGLSETHNRDGTSTSKMKWARAQIRGLRNHTDLPLKTALLDNDSVFVSISLGGYSVQYSVQQCAACSEQYAAYFAAYSMQCTKYKMQGAVCSSRNRT